METEPLKAVLEWTQIILRDWWIPTFSVSSSGLKLREGCMVWVAFPLFISLTKTLTKEGEWMPQRKIWVKFKERMDVLNGSLWSILNWVRPCRAGKSSMGTFIHFSISWESHGTHHSWNKSWPREESWAKKVEKEKTEVPRDFFFPSSRTGPLPDPPGDAFPNTMATWNLPFSKRLSLSCPGLNIPVLQWCLVYVTSFCNPLPSSKLVRLW